MTDWSPHTPDGAARRKDVGIGDGDTPLDELAWARKVVNIFVESGGAAVQLPDGEFVDLPVAERARRILQSRETATGLALRNRR
ncbi:hypothetical protein [Rhodococcus opacus]|uniref:hypothetical protein n=1 Tax=Rhodococcus opacus TaxID=37919 RepID=UPI0035B392D3